MNLIIHNAQTGEIIERSETAAEKKEREQRLADSIAYKNLEVEKATKRETVIAALAAAAGLEVDEVKAALGA